MDITFIKRLRITAITFQKNQNTIVTPLIAGGGGVFCWEEKAGEVIESLHSTYDSMTPRSQSLHFKLFLKYSKFGGNVKFDLAAGEAASEVSWSTRCCWTSWFVVYIPKGISDVRLIGFPLYYPAKTSQPPIG